MQGNYDEPEAMHWRVLELREAVLGRDNPGTLEVDNILHRRLFARRVVLQRIRPKHPPPHAVSSRGRSGLVAVVGPRPRLGTAAPGG